MNCPVCKDVVLAITTREGIEIDHCPKCRGVWMDRGELDKIIERSATYLAPQAVPTPPPVERRPERDDYRDRDYRPEYGDRSYKKKKKRGFLEDMFDFD